jgi:hypothetical protein
MVFAGSSPITTTRHLRKRTRSRGPFLSQHYPASTVIRPRPTPAMAAALRDVEAADRVDFDGLIEALRNHWKTISEKFPAVDEITVIGIGLTKRFT